MFRFLLMLVCVLFTTPLWAQELPRNEAAPRQLITQARLLRVSPVPIQQPRQLVVAQAPVRPVQSVPIPETFWLFVAGGLVGIGMLWLKSWRAAR